MNPVHGICYKTKPQRPYKSTVSVHKDVFSYERLVATSVMEAATFSLSVEDSWP